MNAPWAVLVPRSRSAVEVAWAAGAAVFAFAGAAAIVTMPQLARYIVATAVIAVLLVVGLRWPKAAVVATLLFLPFLGFARRVLIEVAPWTSSDPLLLIAPAVAAVGLYRLYVLEGRRPLKDPLTKLVGAFLILAVLQVANPFGTSLIVNVVGLLFIAVPLLWYFVGQQLGDRNTILALLMLMVPVGVIVALYGTWQVEQGLLPWDDAWLASTSENYAALRVYGYTDSQGASSAVVRAFGTFSSSAEYALYIGTALAVVAVLVLYGRMWALIALPVLVPALWLASARAALVLTLFAILVAAALRTGRSRRAGAVIIGGLVGVLAASSFIVPRLERAASASSNPLVQHQASGLADPFDPKKSTLLVHWELTVEGIMSGVTNPVGYGPGVTNLAADRFGGEEGSKHNAERDFANMFTSFGVVGGGLFVAIMFVASRGVWRLSLARRDPVPIAVAALLIVLFGQWLNGGHYALTPLVWFMLGWVSKAVVTADEAQVDELAPAR